MKKNLIIIFLLSIVYSGYSNETRLLRFPDIHNENIVFSYAGDLYMVGISGGTAKRLTSHPGNEMFPKFSPDGNTIAFSAQYDGNTEIYTIPITGGPPKRLTHTATLDRDDISDRMGPNNIVMTWTNDGKNIIYRSRQRTFNSFKGHLFKVPANGGMSEQLELATGSWCSYSPDGTKLALNRVFREFRTWKYYKGGMADDIWIHDFITKKTINITNNLAQDIFPMWRDNKIFFLSDRDRTMNLFVYDIETEETSKLTNFTRYDIKFPSFDNNNIIFENGGYLYLYNLASSQIEKLNIRINDDFTERRQKYIDASDFIANISIAPDASRIVVSARGEIFSVPVKEGITRRLTNSSGVHSRNAVWSPDGKYIAFISDKSGEYQIYIQNPLIPNTEQKITDIKPTYIYSLKWSPDSKKILWHDKKLGLYYTNIETKTTVRVHLSELGEMTDYDWSPDSNWIAYTDRNESRFLIIFLYNLKTEKKFPVTSEWYHSYNPRFSDDGKYLFFVSNRDFNPIYSMTEWNIAYRDMSKLYFVVLNKDSKSPFAHKNIEVFDDINIDKEDSKSAILSISTDGIINRTEVVPGEAGTYSNHVFVKNKLYYIYHKLNHQPKLYMYDFQKNDSKELGDVRSFQISADKKKMLVRKGRNYHVIDLPNSNLNLKESVSLDGMKIWVDLSNEYVQIFNESWRQMRDYLYDPGMHGVNWENIRLKYSELLDFVNSRDDLNYIIGEMIGELNVGHAYINGGDRQTIQKIKTGLLGAQFSKDKKTGYFKIEKILDGKNWNNDIVSPLRASGLNIKEGDYIIKINNVSTSGVKDIYELLTGMADKLIEITVNTKPEEKNSVNYVVKPISDESELYYFNWVQDNIRKVSLASDGKVGYIHIPDMSRVGLNEFMKHYYPQLSKQALIIDDRGNGGGNVSPMLIERLKREISIMVMSRDVAIPSIKPAGMHFGPKVLLVDQYSASDGDLFPYQFKRHKLGYIVGVRTWGGVVGIRGSLPFIDGADMRKPEFAHYDERGWILEGVGLEPDIIIENDPYLEYIGEDSQLDRAIEVIMIELEKFRKTIPQIPEFPNKSR